MAAWSKRFAAYIKATGMTRAEAARVFAGTPSQVHYWMNGSVPRLKKREEIARLTLGTVTVDGRAPSPASSSPPPRAA